MPTPASRTDLLLLLSDLGIPHKTVDHPPIMTVEEGRAFKASMPGGHSKNLFLKDKKGSLSLITAHCDTEVDLVGLGKATGIKGRWSFGKPDLMVEVLGVAPGSVTPFALMHSGASALSHVMVDKAFFEFNPVWFHPLENTASTAIAPDDLIKFIEHCGFTPKIIDPANPSNTSD